MSICLGLLYPSFFDTQIYWANLCLYSSIFWVCLYLMFELGRSPTSWLRQWSSPHFCIQIRKHAKTEVLQPNGLLQAATISCLTAAWTMWKLLYCSSLQGNRGVDFHTDVLGHECSCSSDHLWALSSTKVQCLWPPGWGLFSVSTWSGHRWLKLSCPSVYWTRGGELLSPMSTSCIWDISASCCSCCFFSVTPSAHPWWRDLVLLRKSCSSLTFSSRNYRWSTEKWAQAKTWKLLRTICWGWHSDLKGKLTIINIILTYMSIHAHMC